MLAIVLNKIDFWIYPSESGSQTAVEWFNFMLSFHNYTENSDLSYWYDNQSLSKLANEQLGIEDPTYEDLNDVMLHSIFSVLSPFYIRSYQNNDEEGKLHQRSVVESIDVNQLVVNWVPYPRTHYMLPCFAQFKSGPDAKPLLISDLASQTNSFNISEVDKDIFNVYNNFLGSCKSKKNDSNIVNVINLNGDITPSELYQNNSIIKSCFNLPHQDDYDNFAKWTYTTMNYLNIPKIGDMKGLERSLHLSANTSCFSHNLDSVWLKFDKTYAKRAFVHYFVGEGLESGEMSEWREDCAALINDYFSFCFRDFDDESELDE